MNSHQDLISGQQDMMNKMTSSLVAPQQDVLKQLYDTMKSSIQVWDSGQLIGHLNQTYRTPLSSTTCCEDGPSALDAIYDDVTQRANSAIEIFGTHTQQ